MFSLNLLKVEEAFIIYDRYTGRHRGFGFVTFADMLTTKNVCSTRIYNLHGRKVRLSFVLFFVVNANCVLNRLNVNVH